MGKGRFSGIEEGGEFSCNRSQRSFRFAAISQAYSDILGSKLGQPCLGRAGSGEIDVFVRLAEGGFSFALLVLCARVCSASLFFILMLMIVNVNSRCNF